MNIYRGPSSHGPTPDIGPVVEFIARAIGGSFISVLIAMTAVGLQIGIEKLFEAFFLGIADSLVGAVVPTVITAAVEGAATATIAQWAIVHRYDLNESREARLRSFFTAALTGAAIGLAFSGLVEGLGSGGSGGGGNPDADFLPVIVVFAIIILFCAIVGSVVFAILNRGLMYLGLRVAAEFSEEAGKRLVEKIAPGFIEEKWSQTSEKENDKSFALVRGLATGTRWLTTCKRSDSNALVRGLIVGVVSGAAAFQLESFARRPNYGFLWQVLVELFGTVVGLVGGCLILAFVVAVFRYPLRLLVDILKLVIIAAIILVVLKACSS
jgi:hypothetical protein